MASIQELLTMAKRELAEHENQIVYLRGRISALEEVSGAVVTPATVPATVKAKSPATHVQKPAVAIGVESGSIVDHIVAIFKQKGGVLKATDIAQEVTARGVTTNSKAGMLPNIFSALSRRSDLFEKVDRGQYRMIAEKDGAETVE